MVEVTPVPSEKVYVCFLPSHFEEQNVKEMFSNFGNITNLVFRKRKDGFTYAHITYESIEQAKAAIKQMNRKQMENFVLKVSFSVQNCVPKWKRQKKFKKIQPKPEDHFNEVFKIGNKKNKKQKKMNKKHEKETYLEKLEKTLKAVVQIKKEVELNEQQQKQKKQEKISIADLKTFQSWLKSKQQHQKDAEENDTAWEQSFDLGDVKKEDFFNGF